MEQRVFRPVVWRRELVAVKASKWPLRFSFTNLYAGDFAERAAGYGFAMTLYLNALNLRRCGNAIGVIEDDEIIFFDEVVPLRVRLIQEG